MSNQNHPTKCKICDKTFKDVSRHFKSHNITSKEYYDKFFKIEGEGICLVCNSDTRFVSYLDGYKKHCSISCSNKNPEYSKNRTIKRLKTEAKNPEIRIKAGLKFKQTEKDNPEIRTGIIESYKKTIDETPEIRINGGKKLSETFKNNPDIMKNARIKQKKTFDDNPEIMINGYIKREQTLSENPEIMIEANKKQSITHRKKFNQLIEINSAVPHFLYIIKHLTLPIIKIGRSENPEKRLKDIVKSIGNCKIIHISEGKYSKIKPLEIFLHEYFNDYCKVQAKGIDGRTEWFDDHILEEVINMVD